MIINTNTYVLKSFDSDQNSFLKSTLEFFSNAHNIRNEIKLTETLKIKLEQDDFLVLYIDELFIEQITQNTVSTDFFLKKEFRNNQVILILDEISIEQLPEYLQYFQTFNIHNNTGAKGDHEETWNSHDDNKSLLFDLLNDIVLHIKRIKSNATGSKLTIYIGPSDDNTTLEYQKITRELLHREYKIIPEVSNPTAKELLENKEYFKNLLESADLAIHFIGHNSILKYPEQHSPALKTNDFVANYCSTPDGELLQRIIYVPSEQHEGSELLNQKILQFKSDTKSLKNAELVQTPVEKFKEVILQKLIELSKPFTQLTQKEETIDDVYLIYPPGFDNEILPYTSWLKENNLSYSVSQVDLDQLELLHYHQKKLTSCKGVLIFNSGNKQWLSRKLSDIKKSPGWGRKMPFKLKAICGLKPQISNNNNNSFLLFENESELNSKTFKELLFD